jgi:hypothetical protein
MDPLKIFATLETPLSESRLREHFRHCGWHADRVTGELANGTCILNLEDSCGNFYLLRGRVSGGDDLTTELELLLRTLELPDTHYSLDVFEEDGRLVKRVQR